MRRVPNAALRSAKAPAWVERCATLRYGAAALVPHRVGGYCFVMIHENLAAAIEDLSSRMLAIRDSL